ncbi:MAG: hypothetical protein ACI4TH_05265 [Candidatus Ornithomonoglobus sp.]
MFRGTTPTLKFTLPIETSALVAAYISVAQNQRVIIEKTMQECTLSGNTISTRLTQEDTLLLAASNNTEIQLRVRLADGSAPSSQIFTVPTKRILKDGVI